MIRILSGAHEFAENAATRPGEEKVLKSVDSAISQELENRFGEKYEPGNEVGKLFFFVYWKGEIKEEHDKLTLYVSYVKIEYSCLPSKSNQSFVRLLLAPRFQ